MTKMLLVFFSLPYLIVSAVRDYLPNHLAIIMSVSFKLSFIIKKCFFMVTTFLCLVLSKICTEKPKQKATDFTCKTVLSIPRA